MGLLEGQKTFPEKSSDAYSGRGNTWAFDDEQQARAMVRRLLETGGDGWRDLAGPTSTS
jgi:hypothetical protein